MTDQPQISVIITTYNNEQDILKCVESVQKQTYQNLEILILNDGSTDHTLEACEKLRQTDKRIRVITAHHAGIGALRNLGIKLVTSDYLMFVDGDDTIAPEFVDHLWTQMQHDQSEIVCSNVYRLDRRGTYYFYKPRLDDQKLHGPNSPSQWLPLEDAFLSFSMPWAKLYKTTLFEQIEYPNQLPEDNFTTWKVFLAARTISYVNVQEYCYRIRHDSLAGDVTDNPAIPFNSITAKEERLMFYRLLNISAPAIFDSYRNFSLKQALESARRNGQTYQLKSAKFKQAVINKYYRQQKE